MKKYYYEIKALQKGRDMELRFAMHAEIMEVINKSTKGEIGITDFCDDIQTIIDNARLIVKHNNYENI